MRIIPIRVSDDTITVRRWVCWRVGLVNYYSGRNIAVAYKSYRYASSVPVYYILYILYPNDE